MTRSQGIAIVTKTYTHITIMSKKSAKVLFADKNDAVFVITVCIYTGATSSYDAVTKLCYYVALCSLQTIDALGHIERHIGLFD